MCQCPVPSPLPAATHKITKVPSQSTPALTSTASSSSALQTLANNGRPAAAVIAVSSNRAPVAMNFDAAVELTPVLNARRYQFKVKMCERSYLRNASQSGEPCSYVRARVAGKAPAMATGPCGCRFAANDQSRARARSLQYKSVTVELTRPRNATCTPFESATSCATYTAPAPTVSTLTACTSLPRRWVLSYVKAWPDTVVPHQHHA